MWSNPRPLRAPPSFDASATRKDAGDQTASQTPPPRNRKLTTCSACGGMMSKSADHCPHCGHVPGWHRADKAVSGIISSIFWLVVVCLLLFLLSPLWLSILLLG